MQSNQTIKTNYFLIKPMPFSNLRLHLTTTRSSTLPGLIWPSWGWPHCRPRRRPAQIWMRQLVLGRPPWQFWIEGGIGPRDASTTPIGPQRTAHLAAVEKTCTPSEIKEVNSCYSLCLKKLFVTNSEKKKTIFKYGMPTTRQQGWQFFVEPKQFQITHWFWPTTLKSIWNWPTDMMVQFELNH